MSSRLGSSPGRDLLRNLQALIGIAACTAALWAVDWRLGLGVFGAAAIATSRFWRAA